jgi:hypothetical protein
VRVLTKEDRVWPGVVSGPLATSVLVLPAQQVKSLKVRHVLLLLL